MSEPSNYPADPRRFSRRRIVVTAEELSKSYAHLHGDFPHDLFTLDFDHVYDTFLYPKYGILLEENEKLGDSNGEKILGFYDARNNAIVLDSVLNDMGDSMSRKKSFTCWHELGHALLHGDWLRANPGRFADGRIITVESGIERGTLDRFELQANLFASHAAAPTWFLDFVLASTFRLTRPIRYVGPASYWLDVWGCRRQRKVESFHDLCVNIAYQIKHRFGGLSIEALSYRIQDSKWVLDVTQDPPISSIPLLRTAPVHVGAALAAV